MDGTGGHHGKPGKYYIMTPCGISAIFFIEIENLMVAVKGVMANLRG